MNQWFRAGLLPLLLLFASPAAGQRFGLPGDEPPTCEVPRPPGR